MEVPRYEAPINESKVVDARTTCLGLDAIPPSSSSNTAQPSRAKAIRILEVGEDVVIIDGAGCVTSRDSSTPRSDDSSVTQAMSAINPPGNNNIMIAIPAEHRELMERNISRVHEIIQNVSAASNVAMLQISNVIEEAYMANDTKFNAASALAWAKGFSFPWEVWSRDNAKLIELGNDFPALVKCRQLEKKAERLNLERVNGLNIQESIWKDRLIDIANGIPIITAAGFIPTNIPPHFGESIPTLRQRLISKYMNSTRKV